MDSACRHQPRQTSHPDRCFIVAAAAAAVLVVDVSDTLSARDASSSSSSSFLSFSDWRPSVQFRPSSTYHYYYFANTVEP